MFLESWHGAKWTARGLKFKHTVEGALFLVAAFGVMASSGWGQ